MTRGAFRFFLLVALTVGLLALSAWAAATERLSEETLRDFVEAGGVWSPIVFVAVASIVPLAWVPRMMTSIIAGALFGFLGGSILALVGGVGGALAGYYVGHRLGHDYVMVKIGRRGRNVVDFLSRHGFLAIALGRISPVTNCEAISLGSGLIGIPMRVYVAATLAGMAPGSVLYAAFGSTVLTDDAGWVSLTTGSIALLMTVATGWWLWRLWKKDRVARESASGLSSPGPVRG